MATSNTFENMTQCKTCRCGEGDTNIWTTRTSDNPDKQIQKCPNCQVLKSGTLFLSSKGIGWTSWKKRWFILTRTSLVFYRSDPNATPQKGSEANLTLGGIDLNSSGSVVVKPDKKLLTVFFPDGRDGRTITLKAETSEDLYDWKTAIENALAQAPSPALTMGQSGILRCDAADSVEASSEQWRDKRPVKSMVVGRPILLALEDLDGSPSFLEKALRFIEDHGIKVEGILRQSADVEEVERRVREYEQGKVEFSADEDAHVVGDCIKHILRELPSSPVPATCCTALVEAYRTDRGSRINAMRAAIADTFPEPNRRLVQRILKMMRTVASHKSVNRMTLSAVAACMAPLLLRPLLAGDCELEDDFNMGGDGSLQLLQAAAAANHAQAIVIILLEEYERVFDDDLLEEASLSSDLYTESEDGDVEDEDLTDNDNLDDDEYNYPDNGLEADIEDDQECSSSGTLSESNSYFGDSYDNKASDDQISNSSSEPDNENAEVAKTLSNATQAPVLQQTSTDISIPRDVGVCKDDISHSKNTDHVVITHGENTSKSQHKLDSHSSPSSIAKCTDMSYEPLHSMKQPTVWGRAPARKNHSMESIDFSSEDEIAIQRLEMTKSDLQTKIAKEEKGNAVLQANLEKRKEVLQERRLALEQDVERLQELLQKERDLKACLETGLMNLGLGQLPITSSMDSKTRADLEEIAVAEADINNLKQKATDLHGQLSQQRQQSYASFCESCSRQLYAMYQPTEMKQRKDVGSTTPVHQNEILRNNENVPFGAVDKDVNTQISHSTPSPKSQLTTKQHLDATTQNNTSYADELHNGICGAALKKSSSSRNENSMLDTECGNAKYQTHDSPYSPDKPQKKLQPNITNQRSMTQEGSINVSSVEPTTFGHDTSSKKSSPRGDTVNKEHVFEKSKTPMSSSTVSCAGEQSSAIHAAASPTSSRDENSMHGARYENVKTQSQDFPSSPNNQSPPKLQSKTTNQSNKTLGSNSISSTEETETSGQRAHCANVKTQTQDSPSSPDKHAPRNLQPNPTSQSGNRSLGPSTVLPVEEPTTFRRSTVSKRSSFRGETQKRDNQDPPTNRQLSQKQQPNNALLNSMKSIGPSSLTSSEEMNRNAIFKRSSTRTEETAASSSSALAKLTSRLNFLKERRVQLANELQNLDVSRPLGPEGPPRTNPR